jgi:hypothetical protein
LFFVDFGIWGMVGALVSAALFTFLGMALAGLGNRLQATSHKQVIQAICGRHLGLLVDWMITFMFGVTVVMLAGGALLEQQFGMPALAGSVLVTLVVVGIVCLDAQGDGRHWRDHPLLILVASAIALYAVFTRDQSFAALDQLASQQQAGTRHWLLGAFLYVSYNIVAGAPILAILGGSAKGEKAVGWPARWRSPGRPDAGDECRAAVAPGQRGRPAHADAVDCQRSVTAAGAGDVPDHLRHDRQHGGGHAVFVPFAAAAGGHGEVPLGLGGDRGGGVRLQPGGVHQPGGAGVPASATWGLC